MVSTSMPEKPKALSPSTAMTGWPVVTAAATEKPMPIPMMPQVPTSRRLRGWDMSTMLRVEAGACGAPGGGVFGRGPALFGVFLPLARGGGGEPVRRRLGPVGANAREQGRHGRTDVADHRGVDAHVAVRLLRRDVDLDELLAAPVLVAFAAPGL